MAVWEPYNQWFPVDFLAEVIQCEVTDHLYHKHTTELNRFATDDHGALRSYLEGPTLIMAKGEGGGGGGWVKLSKSELDGHVFQIH